MLSLTSARRDVAPREQLPVTLPRARVAFVLAVVAAGGLGLTAGLWPLGTLAVALGVLIVGVLLVRLDWAVLVVVATAVFGAYLADVGSWVQPGLVLVMVASWVVRRARGPWHEGPPNLVLIAAAAFLAVVLLSRVLHANGPAGDDVFWRYAMYLAALMVLTHSLRGVVSPVLVAQVYVAACCAAGAIGLASYVLSSSRGAAGPLADPNELAFFLVAAVPMAFGLRTVSRRTWPYDAALVLLLACTVGTLPRGALVGLLALVLFALVARMIAPRLAALIAVGVGTAAAFVIAAFPQVRDMSLGQQREVAAQGLSQRLELWHVALSMVVDHPILGVGPGGFGLFWQDYHPDGAVGSGKALVTGAESMFLGVSAELGLLGLLALLAVWASALVLAWRGWRRDGDPVTAAVACALVGALVAGVFSSEQLALPLWLLAALAAALGPPRDDPGGAASLGRLRRVRDPAQPS